MALFPDIACRFDLCGGALTGRLERAGVGWADERSWTERRVGVVGEKKANVAVLATTKGGGDRAGIGLELVKKDAECRVRWLSMHARQGLVLEVLGLHVGRVECHGEDKSLSSIATMTMLVNKQSLVD